MKTVFHDVDQNSPEWEQLRAGRIGGSFVGKVMANYGKAFGEPAKALAVRIAIEQITGKPLGTQYRNEHMDRGHEQEPIARAMYEDRFFCDVDRGGYFSKGDDEGVSPDGLVCDDGLIEIKSVIETTHYANIKRGGVDPCYYWQVINQLRITGRAWCDFVSFCATFPEGKRLFVVRIYADKLNDFFKMIDARIEEFRALIDDAKKTICKAAV